MLEHLRQEAAVELDKETSRVQADASARGMLGWGGLPLQYVEASDRVWRRLVDASISDLRLFQRTSGRSLDDLKPILIEELRRALEGLRAVSKVDSPVAGRYPFGTAAAQVYEQEWAKLSAYLDVRIRRFELGMDDAAEQHRPSIIYSITADTISGPIQQGTQSSTQMVVVSGDTLLSQMETTIKTEVPDAAQQAQLIELVRDLQATKGTPEFLGPYQRFMAAAANHMTVFAPFLPALAQMLSS